MSRRRRGTTAVEAGPSKRRRGDGDAEADEIEMSQAPDFSYQEVVRGNMGMMALFFALIMLLSGLEGKYIWL